MQRLKQLPNKLKELIDSYTTPRSSGQYASRQQQRERIMLLRRIRACVIGAAVLVFLVLLIRAAVRDIRQVPEATFTPVPEITAAPAPEQTGTEPADATQTPEITATPQPEKDYTADIMLTYGEQSWLITDSDIELKIIGRNAYSGGLDVICHINDNERLIVDKDKLRALLEQIKEDVDMVPISSAVAVVGVGMFTYSESRDGLSLDIGALEEKILDMLGTGLRTPIELTPDVIVPEHTKDSLQETTVLLGECETTLEGSSQDRMSNVETALGRFNFAIFEPDGTLDFNKIVGKRTEGNGFRPATEYDGSSAITGIGGGTCQASTTIYGAGIRAGLQVNERYNHTMTVAYVPASQDAAVSDTGKNLVMTNTTPGKLYVFAYVDRERKLAVCKMYGTPSSTDEYIDIETEIIQTNIQGTGRNYIEDTEGTRIWYSDETPVLYKEGKDGMKSSAYRVYRSVSTGERLRRELLSTDYYSPEDDTYLKGVHQRQ